MDMMWTTNRTGQSIHTHTHAHVRTHTYTDKDAREKMGHIHNVRIYEEASCAHSYSIWMHNYPLSDFVCIISKAITANDRESPL